MHNKPKLVLDTFCEVYDLLKEHADAEFWNFAEHTVIPGAVYLIGRQQFIEHVQLIRPLIEQNVIHVILSNPHEGSETMIGTCCHIGVNDLAQQKRMSIITGGDMDNRYSYLTYDSFLPKLYDYEENVQAAESIDNIFNKTSKPYKFLFLNGRMRASRKYLLERFRLNGLINQSLWTSLDAISASSRNIKLLHNGQDLMATVNPTRTLPPYYEVDQYSHLANPATSNNYVKHALFNNDWGEIYLKPEPYVDTYFSLVTETVFEYPHSFRTEKIWKPIAIGHPFIAVANAGFYRDLHQLGFQTFGHVINESFDSITDSQQRIERIAQVVEELCASDLSSFLNDCQAVCKYNQQHLAHMREQVRQEFPARFFQFLNDHFR